MIEVLLGFGFVWILKKRDEWSIKKENQMKFSLHQYILQPCVVSICRVLSQATESLIWVKEVKITFVKTRFLKLNIAGRHVTYPAITGICDPCSAPCTTGTHCLSCCPSRKWQPKSTAALGTTDSFWQTCMKDEYGLLTSVESSERNDWLAAGERLQIAF